MVKSFEGREVYEEVKHFEYLKYYQEHLICKYRHNF